jgi:hypothetical protein
LKIEIVVPTPRFTIDIPDSFYNASTLQHFTMLVEDHIRNVMMSPDWWSTNPYDMKEAERAYLKRKRGILS